MKAVSSCRSDCMIDAVCFCQFQNRNRLRTGDCGEVGEKFVECDSLFEMIKQRRHGHPCSRETRRTALDVSVYGDRFGIHHADYRCEWHNRRHHAPQGYIADIPDLEACSAFGATPEEALAELRVVREAWIAAAKAARKRIPRPQYRPVIYQQPVAG